MALFKGKGNAKPTRAERAAKEKSKALFNDEFFDVDNGIARLEISELGIYENRSRSSMEAKPTLQEKVKHRSEVESETVSVKHTAEKRKRTDFFNTDFIDIDEERTPKQSEPVPAPMPVAAPTPRAAEEPIFSSAISKTAEREFKPSGDLGAEEIFNSAFDPFEMIMSEELANKPSSRSLLNEKPKRTAVSVNEDISELTEQDIERAKRNEEFERRKAELLRKRNAASAPKVEQAEAVTTAAEQTETARTDAADGDSAEIAAVEMQSNAEAANENIAEPQTEDTGATQPEENGNLVFETSIPEQSEHTAEATDDRTDEPSIEPSAEEYVPRFTVAGDPNAPMINHYAAPGSPYNPTATARPTSYTSENGVAPEQKRYHAVPSYEPRSEHASEQPRRTTMDARAAYRRAASFAAATVNIDRGTLNASQKTEPEHTARKNYSRRVTEPYGGAYREDNARPVSNFDRYDDAPAYVGGSRQPDAANDGYSRREQGYAASIANERYGRQEDYGYSRNASYAPPTQSYDNDPRGTYERPTQSYGAQNELYAAPTQGYGAQNEPYAAPTQGYGVQNEPYAAPTQSYTDEKAAGSYPVSEPTYFGHSASTDSTTDKPCTDNDDGCEYIEPQFKPYAPLDTAEKASDEQKGGLVFEFDTKKHISKEYDKPITLATERTMLFDREDDEGDEDEYSDADDNSYGNSDSAADNMNGTEQREDILANDDADAFEPEEIPEEERNPEVTVMRNMFSALRQEDEATDSGIEIRTESDGYTPIMPAYNEDDAQFGNVADDETMSNDEDAAYEDEDEPPFDAPTSVGGKTAKPDDTKKSEVKKKPDYKNYKKPPLDLLGLESKADDDEIAAEIQENTRIIIETLASFNVTASIKGVDRGPRITRYEVVPAKGVTVNAITHRFDDITLNLAADGIRMEAPIPGKSAIGFEIPNKNPSNVRLRELLECDEFKNAKSGTFVCIGKDVAGNPVFGDIAKFPHALVAGATGMGKSVSINSIMISMLYKARPDEVKFIMIDPKKVEFRMYSGIPHLLVPVVTEAKQAAGALMWAVEEMERRYDLIEKLNIRNIEAYNERQAQDPSIGEHMPKIIIVIDELNDLMMQVRNPVEDLIMRIAQKARAAGIHLIIGTQRPDVKVITGTIKANINTRMSCKVTSVVDSRTILEMAGAEKLLNRGDMLFKPVDKTKPIRVQGAFVSDSEVEAIMDFLKNQDIGAQYDEEIFAEINKAAQKCGNKKNDGGGDDDFGGGDSECGYYNDQKFLDAVELAIRSGKISTSLLQRKMSIGYGKAAKYIDAMEEIGVVGEPNGQKPRDVLISMDEWHEKLTRVGNE